MAVRLLFPLCALMLSGSALAWDGYDRDAGKYHQAEIGSGSDSGYSINVEIYDVDTGEYRTLEMED